MRFGRGTVVGCTIVEDRGDDVHAGDGGLSADIDQLDRADGSGDHARRWGEAYCPVGITAFVGHVSYEHRRDSTGGCLFRCGSE